MICPLHGAVWCSCPGWSADDLARAEAEAMRIVSEIEAMKRGESLLATVALAEAIFGWLP